MFDNANLPQAEKIKPNLKKPIDVYAGISDFEKGRPVIIDQDFYLCSEDDAPTRFDPDTCIKTGRIRMDLTNIVKDELKKMKKEGNAEVPDKLELSIRIELTCGGDKGILEATAKFGLKKIGQCKIEYFADPDAGV